MFFSNLYVLTLLFLPIALARTSHTECEWWECAFLAFVLILWGKHSVFHCQVWCQLSFCGWGGSLLSGVLGWHWALSNAVSAAVSWPPLYSSLVLMRWSRLIDLWMLNQPYFPGLQVPFYILLDLISLRFVDFNTHVYEGWTECFGFFSMT